MYPADRRYTKDHEWIVVSGNLGRVGITDFAQKQLGDVVFVEPPDVGRAVSQGQSAGNIESVKAVSELYSPASGKVVAVNSALSSTPELVNKDPHGTWLFEVELSNPDEVANLLTNDQYAELVK
ncbi:MAG: glycine cleavage system protein GcvH [Acidobacteria bacterium]|jgi:glycine cleavage system H protein|nr:MAG: glycine cleavage system protein GcvH [Acidobacteriota bacterium]